MFWISLPAKSVNYCQNRNWEDNSQAKCLFFSSAIYAYNDEIWQKKLYRLFSLGAMFVFFECKYLLRFEQLPPKTWQTKVQKFKNYCRLSRGKITNILESNSTMDKLLKGEGSNMWHKQVTRQYGRRDSRQLSYLYICSLARSACVCRAKPNRGRWGRLAT